MRRIFFISMLVLWGLSICSVFGKEQHVRYLTTEMGLNNGAIIDIVQDADGYMWMATWDGIMRYDGYAFRSYKPDVSTINSLQARQAFHLLVDSTGDLWALNYGGIARYNRQLDYFEPVELEGSGLVYNLPYLKNSLTEADGVLYINLVNDIYYYELTESDESPLFKKLVVSEELQSSYYNLVSIDNQLIIIKRLQDKDETEIYTTELNPHGGSPGLELSLSHTHPGTVNNIVSKDSASRFIRKANEIGIEYGHGSSRSYEVLVPNVSSDNLLYTSDNQLWFSLAGAGVGSHNFHTGTQTYYTHQTGISSLVRSNQIASMFEDFSGNLWIGHLGQGVSILNLYQKSFSTFRHVPGDPSSLSENTIMSFQETNDGILVGTDNDGINILYQNVQSGKRRFERMLWPDNFFVHPSPSIWNIAREFENEYWMASNFGLIHSKKRGNSWEHRQYFLTQNQQLRLRKIFLDQHHNMWVGTHSGLFLLPYNQRESMTFHQFLPDPDVPGSISDLEISEFLVDSRDRFWIGTRDEGVNLLQTSYSDLNLSGTTAPELKFTVYSAGDTEYSLNNNEINCLFEYYDGSIWIGTQGGGINILDPETGHIEYITTEEGLPGNNVFGILSDEQGNLWLSTNKGICSISTFESERKISTYDPSDGIQGNVFMIGAFFKDSRDMLYFGGRNGFTRFIPSQIHSNNIAPRLVFNDLLIFGDKVEVNQARHKKTILPKVLNESDTLVLSYKDYSLRFGVSAIHFQNPSQNKIQYRLLGFDNNWLEVPEGERYIYFSNLNPGRYTLQVRAANSDDYWSEQIKEMSLLITPPWYNTWYGYLLFILIFSAIAVALFSLILRQQVLRHKIKLDAVQIENMKELNETKLRFFTNISHELRTPLNLVLAPIEYIYKYKDITPAIKEQLAMSLRNAKLLKRLINNIIEFRKYEADKVSLKYTRNDIVEFIRQVCRNFETLQPNTNVKLTYHLPNEAVLADYDTGKLEQSLYNILSNAFKHTEKGGTILLTLEQHVSTLNTEESGEDIIINVFNEGKPIPEEHIDKIFDRFYQTGDRGEGSGIGLSVAKSFVELHKGLLSVRNVENSGVEFSIRIPRFNGETEGVAETESHEMETREEEADVNLTVVKGSKEDEAEREVDLKLLVIEDNHELRSFYQTILSPSFKFFEAQNGTEGIKLAEEIIPDIIISDVMMPEKNGYEVCKHLKNNLMTSHIPLIMLTAKDAPDQIVQGYKSGADAYVIKPFDSEVLISQIDCILKNRERIREKYMSSGFLVNRSPEAPKTKDDHFMKTLNDELEENLFNEDYNVVSLSQKLNISRNHLYRKVKALTSYSTVEYIRVYKLNKAAELLKTQKYSIKEVCFKTGFKDQSYFTKSFKNHFNQNPTEFIKTYSQAQ